MTEQALHVRQFKQKLCSSLVQEMLACSTIKVSINNSVYDVGDENNLIYFIERGEVIKFFPYSPENKECVLAVRSSGDIFGESSIGNSGKHIKKAVAITDTYLKTFSPTKFLAHLSKEFLLQDFIQYVAIQVVEQQQIIANIISSYM